ncbi:MAG TPA: carbamoyltransferase [Rhodospirillaceae bacterium]|nr:carbamoyltransferase [Rhodospirillaceae bacterium]
MIAVGLNTQGHDCGAALLRETDGELHITAIAEARLDRVPHSAAWPRRALDYCLAAAGLGELRQADCVGTDADFDHLDCHAASAWYLSGFEDAAVLVLDAGQGLYHGQGTALKALERRRVADTARYFAKVTEKCGFDAFGAGKTMALYGFAEGFARRDPIGIPAERFDGLRIDYGAAFGRLDALAGFDPALHPQGLIDEPWVNLAREAQEAFFEDVLHLARMARQKTGSRHLCLAGGAFLSCIANRRLLDSGLVDDIFIQPAASDEGIALGAALLAYYRAGGQLRLPRLRTAMFGHRPAEPPMAEFVRARQLRAHPATVQEVAALLADGRVVARFAGASEFGPRALGNRSILADPRRPGMARHINEQVKHREVFRPFAPSVLAEAAGGIFDLPVDSPFMLLAARPRPEWRDRIPAVLHVDGSSRLQTVHRQQSPDYYALIEAFGAMTGVPLLLNTSFNDAGEPIVESREDALASFCRTGIDDLYLDGWLVEKPAAV